MTMTTDDKRFEDLALQASQVFSPGAPINERDLFSGRREQIRRAVDAVNQAGQHAIIFGERGVGKTSLSRVLSQYLSVGHNQVVTPSVNCETADSFGSVWKKVFSRIDVIEPGYAVMGFSNPGRQMDVFKLSDRLAGDPINADAVRDQLEQLSQQMSPVIIVDEFDRLPRDAARGFADVIKGLSDHAVGATVILVGVGDSVDHLIEDHESVGRALKQIRMPRMASDEIVTIVQKGLDALGMTITDDALRRIILLARGLPHYAHLMGLHASRAALDDGFTVIDVESVQNGIEQAINDAQRTIQTAFLEATQSVKKVALFGDVLLACALADSDERGYFSAADVRTELRKITGKEYDIPSFAQHLADFSSDKRGNVLIKEGDTRYKYRFRDPLMQPYVVMQGLKNEKVDDRILELGANFPHET